MINPNPRSYMFARLRVMFTFSTPFHIRALMIPFLRVS